LWLSAASGKTRGVGNAAASQSPNGTDWPSLMFRAAGGRTTRTIARSTRPRSISGSGRGDDHLLSLSLPRLRLALHFAPSRRRSPPRFGRRPCPLRLSRRPRTGGAQRCLLHRLQDATRRCNHLRAQKCIRGQGSLPQALRRSAAGANEMGGRGGVRKRAKATERAQMERRRQKLERRKARKARQPCFLRRVKT
jgi:hypothetical protein